MKNDTAVSLKKPVVVIHGEHGEPQLTHVNT